ncbi:RNA polymerase Rpb4-domain-containing protein [Powellomyces hirtus]|nr:RNA polymerase Rpb4-domain-containing protein [Powellomyces hirtus]
MEVLELKAAHRMYPPSVSKCFRDGNNRKLVMVLTRIPIFLLVSNSEVLTFLTELQTDREQNVPVVNPGAPLESNLKDLYEIESEVVTFLRGTPCAEQDEAVIKAFMEALRKYDLTKGEKLMLLNLRPKSIAELNPMVEDLDNRLREEEQEALVALICELLPYTEPVTEEGDAMDTIS